MKDESLEDGIRRVGPWFHDIELAPGIRTREVNPAPEWRPVNFPYKRWKAFRDVIPADLSGRRVLDIGSAEGFFAFELARRGARVVAVDAAAKMIKRLKFAADVLHLSDKIEARIGTAEMLDTSERYDAVLCLALLYHLQSPFTFLQKLSKLSDTIYLESAIDPGENSLIFFSNRSSRASTPFPSGSQPGSALLKCSNTAALPTSRMWKCRNSRSPNSGCIAPVLSRRARRKGRRVHRRSRIRVLSVFRGARAGRRLFVLKAHVRGVFSMRSSTSSPCRFQKCSRSMKIQFSVSLSPERRYMSITRMSDALPVAGVGNISWPEYPPAVMGEVDWKQLEPYVHIHPALSGGPYQPQEVNVGHLSGGMVKGLFAEVMEFV